MTMPLRDRAEYLAPGEALALREALGLPRQWVADHLGVTIAGVRSWDIGRTRPSAAYGELLVSIDLGTGAVAQQLARGARPDPGTHVTTRHLVSDMPPTWHARVEWLATHLATQEAR